MCSRNVGRVVVSIDFLMAQGAPAFIVKATQGSGGSTLIGRQIIN